MHPTRVMDRHGHILSLMQDICRQQNGVKILLQLRKKIQEEFDFEGSLEMAKMTQKL